MFLLVMKLNGCCQIEINEAPTTVFGKKHTWLLPCIQKFDWPGLDHPGNRLLWIGPRPAFRQETQVLTLEHNRKMEPSLT